MKHYIICKFCEGFNLSQHLIDIKNIFDQTKHLEGIKEVSYIENVINRPNRADLMICIEMDKESLSIYDSSLPHKEWKEKYSKYIVAKTIFDANE